jgi:hypothetical protein
MQYPPILYKDITILLVLTQAPTTCHTSYYRMNASLIRMAQNEGDADTVVPEGGCGNCLKYLGGAN